MKCDCRKQIEKGKDEKRVFKSCTCSRSCRYCAERNLIRTDWSYYNPVVRCVCGSMMQKHGSLNVLGEKRQVYICQECDEKVVKKMDKPLQLPTNITEETRDVIVNVYARIGSIRECRNIADFGRYRFLMVEEMDRKFRELKKVK